MQQSLFLSLDLADLPPTLTFLISPSPLPKQKGIVRASCGVSLLYPWEALRLAPLGPKNPKVFWELPAC